MVLCGKVCLEDKGNFISFIYKIQQTKSNVFWGGVFPRLLFLSGFKTLQRVWCILLWPNGSWDRLQGREGAGGVPVYRRSSNRKLMDLDAFTLKVMNRKLSCI